MYENFKSYFPTIAEQIVSWHPSGEYTIVAQLDDNSIVEYNDITRAIRNVIPYDGSEKSWKREFAHRLAVRMAECGYNAKRLSELSGVSCQSIGCYIHRQKIPSGHTINKLAKALGCRPRDLDDF